MSINNDILSIYKGKQILNSYVLCNEFYKYYVSEFLPYNINHKEQREIEVIIKAPFSIFTTLFNYNKSEKTSYIEIKNSIDKYTKKRLRKNLKDYSFYINNKKNFIELLKNETLELKITHNITPFGDGNNIFFKSANERLCPYNSNQVKKIHVYLVNSISIKNKYFKAEIRQKTLLTTPNNKDNALILSYFSANNESRAIDFEIEVLKSPEQISESEFKKYFIQILQYSFAISKPEFYINFDSNLYKNLYTNMINISQLLVLPYTDYIILKKIDGESTQFYVKNSICYITKNNVIHELSCNIPKDYEMGGIGEYLYLNNTRSIYPFYFHVIKKKNKNIELTSRTKHFEYLAKIIQNSDIEINNAVKKNIVNKNEVLGIIFKTKEVYGPYNERDKFLENCLKCFSKISSYPTDGIILSKNTEVDSSKIIDYKFKQNNTIDLYTNFTLPDTKSKMEDLHFNLSLMFKEDQNSKKIIELYKVKISSSSSLCYDHQLSMIIYEKQGLYQVFPVIFIAEYDIDKNIFMPRLDKTNKIFLPSKYYGNQASVIIESIIIHKYKLYSSYQTISTLLNEKEEKILAFANRIKNEITEKMKTEQDFILNISNSQKQFLEELEEENDDEKEKNYIIEPLNYKKNWYKSDSNNTSRTALNILSNLNKTYGISYGIGPFVNKSNFKTVFSIYCGKGGDMGRFVNNGINYVVGIDPDKNALRDFEDRRKSYIKEKNQIFKLVTIQLSLEENNFLDKVYQRIGINQTFDIIDFQLGIHFSFTKETENHIANIFKVLSNKNKEPKTRLLISTNDKDNIEEIFTKYGKDTVDLNIDQNNIFQIARTNTNKISVFYSASMNQPMEEYVMSKEYLVPFLNNQGFKLIQSWTFDEIIQDQTLYNNLHKMYKRASAKNFLNQIKNINPKEFDILEILSIFRYYIFECQHF